MKKNKVSKISLLIATLLFITTSICVAGTKSIEGRALYQRSCSKSEDHRPCLLIISDNGKTHYQSIQLNTYPARVVESFDQKLNVHKIIELEDKLRLNVQTSDTNNNEIIKINTIERLR